MRQFIAFSLLLCLLAGCQMPNDGNILGGDGGNQADQDYEIILPEEPAVTTPVSAPSETQAALMERITNSLGNEALAEYSGDIAWAIWEYAKENPSLFKDAHVANDTLCCCPPDSSAG